MTEPRDAVRSDYMHFAKFSTSARYNLASSGVLDCVLEDLDLTLADLALHGPNAGGYLPLVDRIADRFAVNRACVVMPGGGCSFANHLALAALISPGDEVLAESPTYELLLSTARYLGARLRRFTRSPTEAWALDPQAVAEALTPKTRLIVLTDLHNPSSRGAAEHSIRKIAGLAHGVGALVLVDEVYRELTFPPGTPRTAFTEGPNIVVTSSLTKAYGLSALRCGWILAPPALAERMRRLNDLFGVHPPHVAERMALLAFDRLDALAGRARGLIDANRAAYRELLGGHRMLEQVVFDEGTTVFPRLLEGDGDQLHQRLQERFETSIVPGRFFERPHSIRIGLGGEPTSTRAGLERLAAALDEMGLA